MTKQSKQDNLTPSEEMAREWRKAAEEWEEVANMVDISKPLREWLNKVFN